LKLLAALRALKNCNVAQVIMSSGKIRAIAMMNRRRDAMVIFPSSIPGTFGWIAVHVHANKVAVQLHQMSHTVLVGESWTSSVGIVVSLRPRLLGSDVQKNGMYSRTSQNMRIIMELSVPSIHLFLSLRARPLLISPEVLQRPLTWESMSIKPYIGRRIDEIMCTIQYVIMYRVWKVPMVLHPSKAKGGAACPEAETLFELTSEQRQATWCVCVSVE